jgi:uncharacterized membrane protein YkoI
MRLMTGVFICTTALFAAETKVKMADLPAAVQKSIQEQLKGGEVVGLSKETAKGKTVYEVETKLGGKTRDMILDGTGAVTEVEEEIEMSAVPQAARDAITKKAAGAKITRVEALSKGGSVVAYEAAVMKGSKASEIAVTPEGKPFKD